MQPNLRTPGDESKDTGCVRCRADLEKTRVSFACNWGPRNQRTSISHCVCSQDLSSASVVSCIASCRGRMLRCDPQSRGCVSLELHRKAACVSCVASRAQSSSAAAAEIPTGRQTLLPRVAGSDRSSRNSTSEGGRSQTDGLSGPARAHCSDPPRRW